MKTDKRVVETEWSDYKNSRPNENLNDSNCDRITASDEEQYRNEEIRIPKDENGSSGGRNFSKIKIKNWIIIGKLYCGFILIVKIFNWFFF